MIFSLYNNFGAQNSAPIFQALESGLKKMGHSVTSHDANADVAVIWSKLWVGRMRPNRDVWQLYKSNGRPVLVIEVGCLLRNHTWRIMLDGHNRMISRDHDDQRFRQFGLDVIPWRNRGQNIMIALQRPDSEQWQGMPPLEDWVWTTVKDIRNYTDRPIVIRPHPRFRRIVMPPGCDIQQPRLHAGSYDDFDFDSALDDVWAVINWNSNPGVASVIQGVPAFVGPDSLAREVSNTDLACLENPRRPDRQQWINDLCWTEWTVPEIQTGLALSHVLSSLR